MILLKGPSPKTPESDLWKWLRTGLQSYKRGAHFQRIENDVASGFPDVDAMVLGIPLLIELKTAARPVRATSQVNFKTQQSQIYWATRRSGAGGISFFLIQVGSGRQARRYLIDGRKALIFQGQVTEKDLYEERVSGTSTTETAEQLIEQARARAAQKLNIQQAQLARALASCKLLEKGGV